MNRLNFNWACLTPRVAAILSPEEVPCLRRLVIGGEAVSVNGLEP